MDISRLMRATTVIAKSFCISAILLLLVNLSGCSDNQDIQAMCNKKFPNDMWGRHLCVRDAEEEQTAHLKKLADERAEQVREQNALPCLAEKLPALENKLSQISSQLVREFNEALVVAQGNPEAMRFADAVTSLKKMLGNDNGAIVPSKGNIKEAVYVFTLNTGCSSKFYYLVNLTADESGRLKGFNVWAKETPTGAKGINTGSLWNENFVNIRKNYFDGLTIKKAETERILAEKKAYEETMQLVASLGHAGWTADRATDCKAWNNSPRLDETVRWSGGCVDGLVEGEGTLTWTWSDGSQIISGTFVKGKVSVDGFVDILTIEGDGKSSFKGFRLDGKAQGKGIAKYKDGSFYDGSWKEGKFSGVGLRTYADKSQYDGSWREGRKEGFGVYTYSDRKTRYEGNWLNDLPEGSGMIVYANGTKASGFAYKGCVWEMKYSIGSLLWRFNKTEGECVAEKK